jgi:hypothetical protein
MFDPLNPDINGEKAPVKRWASELGILPLFRFKMITASSHAGNEYPRLGSLGDPTQLPYLSNKRRTKDKVEIMQSTEE